MTYLLQLVIGITLAALTTLIAAHCGEPSAVWLWEKLL